MSSSLKRIGIRFLSGLIGVVILFGIFVYQNEDIRGNLPFFDPPMCTQVTDWNRDSNPYRSDFMLNMSALGPVNNWTDADYENVLNQIDGGIAWLEDNPPPSDAEIARETYIESLKSLKEDIEASQAGEFENEAEFSAAIDDELNALIEPAYAMVPECHT